jgi:hypothetical protein
MDMAEWTRIAIPTIPGGMDTHRNTNDSGWADQSSIPNSFSTKWFEAQINVWARRIDLSLRRIFERGSHWAPAPVAVAASSLVEERGGPVRGCDACPVASGWAGPGLRCVSCHVRQFPHGCLCLPQKTVGCQAASWDTRWPRDLNDRQIQPSNPQPPMASSQKLEGSGMETSSSLALKLNCSE